MSKELLQQALELAMRCPWSEERAKLADTLRSALAAPAMEAEPCYCDRMQIGVPGVSCGDCPRDYKPAAPAPAVPLTDEQFADIVAEASLAVDLAANPLKLLAFARAVLAAAPAVREPQDERIRWRDAVIKEAESALRTAEQEFADMPTWANMGHAAKKVTHALAVIAALGIGGGGNG